MPRDNTRVHKISVALNTGKIGWCAGVQRFVPIKVTLHRIVLLAVENTNRREYLLHVVAAFNIHLSRYLLTWNTLGMPEDSTNHSSAHRYIER